MSDTVHKATTLTMLERDVENKYAHIKERGLKTLSSLSASFPLLRIALPSIDKWLVGKEQEFLPKVQDLVNMCVEMSFVQLDVGVEEAYINAKKMFNEGISEMIQAHSQFTLESVDQMLQILIGTKLSI